MTKLRCYPGCLAVVTRSYAGNEGAIVRCIRLATRDEEAEQLLPGDHGPRWVVDRWLPRPFHADTNLPADAQLTPITPPPATESTDTPEHVERPVELVDATD